MGAHPQCHAPVDVAALTAVAWHGNLSKTAHWAASTSVMWKSLLDASAGLSSSDEEDEQEEQTAEQEPDAEEQQEAPEAGTSVTPGKFICSPPCKADVQVQLQAYGFLQAEVGLSLI